LIAATNTLILWFAVLGFEIAFNAATNDDNGG